MVCISYKGTDGRWKKEITDLKNFTEGNYTIFNLPFEGKELEDACRDFNTLKMNYSILPDLKVGNDNSQIAVANADRNKFEIWIKMYREDMIKQDKQPGNIYEMDNESYMDTAAINEDEYIDNASLEYQKVNSEFKQHEVPGPKVNVMQKDDSEEFARLKKDGNYEMVTINRETLVDNMAFTSVSKRCVKKAILYHVSPAHTEKMKSISYFRLKMYLWQMRAEPMWDLFPKTSPRWLQRMEM